VKHRLSDQWRQRAQHLRANAGADADDREAKIWEAAADELDKFYRRRRRSREKQEEGIKHDR
jgi:hypothetical protein